MALLLSVVSSTVASGQALILTTSTPAVSISTAASDYNPATGDAASTLLSGNTFGIKSTSSSWTLSVRALTGTFIFSPSLGDANPNKPCNELSVKVNGTTTWLAASTASQVVATGPRGNLTGAPKQVPIDYQFLSNLADDPPGNYSITLIWTVTNP
jgi:hypothetical protein